MQSVVIGGDRPWVRRVRDITPSHGLDWHLTDGDASAVLRGLLRTCQLRYVFFVHYSRRVPDDLLAECECVNFHCTALPYGRGGHPIENLLLRGHTSTVVTAHRMVTELDAGPVYAVSAPLRLAGQRKDDILMRLAAPVSRLLRQVADYEPAPVPQAGPVVQFTRLDAERYQRFWAARGDEKEATAWRR